MVVEERKLYQPPEDAVTRTHSINVFDVKDHSSTIIGENINSVTDIINHATRKQVNDLPPRVQREVKILDSFEDVSPYDRFVTLITSQFMMNPSEDEIAALLDCEVTYIKRALDIAFNEPALDALFNRMLIRSGRKSYADEPDVYNRTIEILEAYDGKILHLPTFARVNNLNLEEIELIYRKYKNHYHFPEIVSIGDNSRELEVAQMRLLGLKYAEIAEQLELSKSRVKAIVIGLNKKGILTSRKVTYKQMLDKVSKMWIEGYTAPQIAHELDKSISTINNAISDLYRKSLVNRKRRDPSERDNRVEKLTKEGLTQSQIAAEINVPLSTVESSVRRLIRVGRLSPKFDVTKINLFDEEILSLRKQKVAYRDIMDILHLEQWQVQAAVRRLIKAGKLQSRKSNKHRAVKAA